MSYVLRVLEKIQSLDELGVSTRRLSKGKGTGYPPMDALNRVYPALVHKTTGKLTTGRRGETHSDLAGKVYSRGESELENDAVDPVYSGAMKNHHAGFYDPRTKEFYSRGHPDWSNVDSPDLTRHKSLRAGMFRGTESVILERLDISTPQGAFALRNLVPAFVHPDTKKMYIGRRGETHNDIIDRHSDEIDPIHKDRFDPHDRGFYHTVKKTFISKADSGYDSADLMTKPQRMRKLGHESFEESGSVGVNGEKEHDGFGFR